MIKNLLSHLITKHKDWLIGLCIAIPMLGLAMCMGPRDKAKYQIYAVGRYWDTNHFQVSGNTVYFTSTDGKNVCIVGDYTLIYERENDTQRTQEQADRQEN